MGMAESHDIQMFVYLVVHPTNRLGGLVHPIVIVVDDIAPTRIPWKSPGWVQTQRWTWVVHHQVSLPGSLAMGECTVPVRKHVNVSHPGIEIQSVMKSFPRYSPHDGFLSHRGRAYFPLFIILIFVGFSMRRKPFSYWGTPHDELETPWIKLCLFRRSGEPAGLQGWDHRWVWTTWRRIGQGGASRGPGKWRMEASGHVALRRIVPICFLQFIWCCLHCITHLLHVVTVSYIFRIIFSQVILLIQIVSPMLSTFVAYPLPSLPHVRLQMSETCPWWRSNFQRRES